MENSEFDNPQVANQEMPRQCLYEMTTAVNNNQQNPPIDNFPVCCGCGHVIDDSAFLLVGFSHWHVTCLKCCACAVPLAAAHSCFVKDGRVFCKEDYGRLFSMRPCAHCGIFIESHEWVMKVRDHVYHATKRCFSCSVCQRPLVRGERYVTDSKGLICFSCVDIAGDFYGSIHNKVGRPKKKKLNVTSSHLDSICGMTINYATDEVSPLGGGSPSYHPPKSKRMRTSFKHHQLRSMKAYFNHNHNPDAKDLKQLSQETGLTKRVLQVWFQNARAKHRRSCVQDDKDKSKDDEKLKKSKSETTDVESTSVDDSPNSSSFIYDTSSHCDEMSPEDDYQQNSFTAQGNYLPYNNKLFMGSMTSLTSAASPTSPVSSALGSVQAITSPCNM
uniref:LIM/homeobox protein Lhx9 n=1 Tax=Phallusia mammillata TaxID=59560 RepID=A0A6F9DIZ6_9ASCI|nr:LIM/homeobox protein Lhx9 [Phallusia mammillata]